VNHSYEGLDRAGGLARGGLLAPLAEPDYRRLLTGLSVSLLGDGVFLVALAWQVYTLRGAPSALGAVGIAMTVPTIACLLLGGVVSDRYDRRRVMMCADAIRALAIGALAGLALCGSLTFADLLAGAVIQGAAGAFFDPASDAIVPELLDGELLAQANALDQLVRPLALRLGGPALGGAVVAILGSGGAFACDALSFLISGLAVATLAARAPRPGGPENAGLAREIATGLRYVRSQPWLWVTFASAAIAYLLFMGPVEVLLPYLVKEQLHEHAASLGLVYAAGGAGSLVCAAGIGGRGLPRRPVRFIYLTWTVATLAVAGYGVARSDWGLALASVAFNALETVGTIVWITLKQRMVPAHLLGRVSSLDWLISIGLLPLSYGLTGPVSSLLGVRTTLIGAGVLGALVTAAGLLVPGVRDPDAAWATTSSGAGLAPLASTE
jgi:DHA3 family tetracycline resistance protein-like MFS transporter